MWRIRLDNEPDVVIRLPRRTGSAAGVEQEIAVLRHVAQSRFGAAVMTPSVRHVGQPSEVFPHRWSALEWIDGTDAWAARDSLGPHARKSFASDLGQAVSEIAEINDVDVRRRTPGSRGGPIGPLLDRLEGWLNNPEWNAESLIDVDAVKRLAAAALVVLDEPVMEGFVHGDLIPGNLLLDSDRLTSIIDWGGAGWGDTAQDLAPAWSVFATAERSAFREATGADDAAWIRGRTFELEHAVGGVLYYKPRQHPLGDVMACTLDRLLA